MGLVWLHLFTCGPCLVYTCLHMGLVWFTLVYIWASYGLHLFTYVPHMVYTCLHMGLVWFTLVYIWFTYGPRCEKTCLGCLPTTRAHTSLHIPAVWSAPLLFVYWIVSYLDMLYAIFLLCSLRDWFESPFLGNPKDSFFLLQGLWQNMLSHNIVHKRR